MKNSKIDMCNGPLLKKMLIFTVPVILTGILQLLFNAADLIVVGRFGSNGSNSVAAVGATSSLCNLIINFFIAGSMGSGVAVAQAIGSKNDKDLYKCIHTAIPIALLSGLILSVIGICFSKSFLIMMSTPDEIIDLSALYMRIYFSGIIFSLLYNFGASILRAIGDTKRPLIYLILAGFINVALNILFVTVFNLDVAGVALATVISQFVSATLVLGALMRRNDNCRLFIFKIRFYSSALKKILKISIPAGIQSVIFSFSNVLIQSSVNSLSHLNGFVAGNAAASNIEGFVYIIMNSFYQTTINFTGQNIGAKKYDRVKKIFRIALVSVSIVGLISGLTVFFFATPLLKLYIIDSTDAVKWGIVKLGWVCAPYFLCGIMEVSTGVLRGMGKSIIPMIITIFGVFVIRNGWVLTIFQIPKFHNPHILYCAYPISWIFTFLVQFIAFMVIFKKYNIDDKSKSGPSD